VQTTISAFCFVRGDRVFSERENFLFQLLAAKFGMNQLGIKKVSIPNIRLAIPLYLAPGSPFYDTERVRMDLAQDLFPILNTSHWLFSLHETWKLSICHVNLDVAPMMNGSNLSFSNSLSVEDRMSWDSPLSPIIHNTMTIEELLTHSDLKIRRIAFTIKALNLEEIKKLAESSYE
jgi:hypothetical protein